MGKNVITDGLDHRRPSKFVDRRNGHRNGSRSTNQTVSSRSPSYFTEDDPQVFMYSFTIKLLIFSTDLMHGCLYTWTENSSQFFLIFETSRDIKKMF